MIDLANADPRGRTHNLRVDTLVRLRWLAIGGQSIAILLVYFGLGFHLQFGLAFLVIGCSAWLNIGLRLRFSISHRLADGPAFFLLAYDVLQLSALLFLTGGLENPFAILFLAPVMISAVSLPGPRTLILGALMVIAATVLVFWHLPLPWHPDQTFSLPVLYKAGIWVAIVLGVGFTGIYASRVATEARQLSDALSATELVLAREQHLTQLDGLAAAAAHELGTPLATITIVVKEMARQVPADGALGEDVALLAQEVARCRAILSKIASLGEDPGTPLDEMTVTHLIEDVVGPQRNFGVDVQIAIAGADGATPVCRRNPAILYGLGNLVENAIDFARSTVSIEASWNRDIVRIVIADDGPGFSADVLSRLGDPYVTTRGPQRKTKAEEGAGLGLGLFIAKTLLERSGASVETRNAGTGQTGARVVVAWPRGIFEHGRAATRIASAVNAD